MTELQLKMRTLVRDINKVFPEWEKERVRRRDIIAGYGQEEKPKDLYSTNQLFLDGLHDQFIIGSMFSVYQCIDRCMTRSGTKDANGTCNHNVYTFAPFLGIDIEREKKIHHEILSKEMNK